VNRPDAPAALAFEVNGRRVELSVAPGVRLSDVLRDTLGLTGTKVGCHAGDCGACTVLLDDEQVCACLVAVGQCAGRRVRTVEGLAGERLGRLQQAFVDHGAAQCGICTPGMLMAAQATLERYPKPTEAQVLDGIGGVLCRCTGYRKIVEAVLAAAGGEQDDVAHGAPQAGRAVGARLPRLDADAKVTGTERYGADEAPPGSLWLRVIRSPYERAEFSIGDTRGFVAQAGLSGVLTAADIPNNRFAIFPDLRDQPALAEERTRFRGEAVMVLVGPRRAVEAVDPARVPIRWHRLPAVASADLALAAGALPVHERWPDNVLCRGRVVHGDVDPALAAAAIRCEAQMSTAYVEHAYIEPEAGWAQWSGTAGAERLTVFACTQTPYMDRDELAWMFGLEPTRVRVIPSAVGGGFGGKLDMSIQPLLAAAARKFGRPARIVFDRPESMASTTKRHPAQMRAAIAADARGNLLAYDFSGDFNTGAYASWGPTVANRVPIHASGPYRIPGVRALTRAVFTNDAVSGAFRGFGVPQSTLINEALVDEVALRVGEDPLEFRYRHALRVGDTTATGQRLQASVGLRACLEALRPAWRQARARAERFNAGAHDAGALERSGSAGETTLGGSGRLADLADPHGRYPQAKRRGVGVACMWYGIGNTVIANPSSMTVGLRRSGRFVLYNGAVDIGQGTYTVMPQICADALGVPVALIDQVTADTDLTLDAGKSSASRQTFVSGNAARLAGEDLRAKLLAQLGLPSDGAIAIEGGELVGVAGATRRRLALSAMGADERGDVALGSGYFDPPTVPLDADGQGVPYATYGFAAQFAEVEVDIELGTTRVLAIHAAHDVGRAVNPTQVEGQIHGGIAQGLGLALMEEYLGGRTDNLHDYLIPTAGDIPPITIHLIEDPEPLGPFGAKGVGEPALVATAPAILNAIHHATGVRVDRVPATPDRLRAAILAGASASGEPDREE
jgi:CO/xanthine dehydrogenase Mo-binding subunit/aerobic-type carbon monoxide dehydrogenase small subunit (CoxS/CutS family)